eukprot:g30672.t1
MHVEQWRRVAVVDIGYSSARLGFAGEDPQVVDGLPGLLRYGGKALDFDSSAVQAVFRKLSAQDGCRRPLLLSEPATSAEKTRLRCLLAELSFEALEAPEVSTLSSALLATLARGKSNGTVVDIGAGLTSIAPLLNGCVEPECLREQTFAGNALDIMVLDALKSQGVTLSMPSRRLADRDEAFVHGTNRCCKTKKTMM